MINNQDDKVLNINILKELENELNEKNLFFVKQTLENKLRVRQQKLLKAMESCQNKLFGKENAKGIIKGGLLNKANELKEEKEIAEEEGHFDAKAKRNYLTNVLIVLIEANELELKQKLYQREYNLNAFLLGDRKKEKIHSGDELEGIIASIREHKKTLENFADNITSNKSEMATKGNIKLNNDIDETEGNEDVDIKKILGDSVITDEEKEDIAMKDVKVVLKKDEEKEAV